MRQVRRFFAAGLLQTTLAPFPVVANGERFAFRSRTCRVFPNPRMGVPTETIGANFSVSKPGNRGHECSPWAWGTFLPPCTAHQRGMLKRQLALRCVLR
jgi:hypothetical protein